MLFTDENMAAEGAKSFHRVGSLMRSKSESTLIDLSDACPTSDNLKGKILSFRNKSQNITTYTVPWLMSILYVFIFYFQRRQNFFWTLKIVLICHSSSFLDVFHSFSFGLCLFFPQIFCLFLKKMSRYKNDIFHLEGNCSLSCLGN